MGVPKTKYRYKSGGGTSAGQAIREQAKNYKKTRKKVEKAGSGGGGPSVLSRTFDVLSRPLYGVAETSKRLIEGDITGVPQGLLGGLSGKNKTTFDNVLEVSGMDRGWLRTGLGLGLDVALDPTTYLGIGVVKGIGKGAAATRGTETALKSLPDLMKAGELRNAIRASGGGTISGQILTKKGRLTKGAAKNEGVQSYLRDLAQKEADNILSENKGALHLKIAGKPIRLNKNVEEAAYAKLGTVASKLGNTGIGQAFNTAFRPKGIYGALHGIQRTAELPTHAHLELALADAANGTDKVLKFSTPEIQSLALRDLAKGERQLLQQALRRGEDVGSELAEKTQIPLSQYQNKLREGYDQLFSGNKSMGLYDDAKKAKNYAYDFFEKARPEDLRRWKEYTKRIVNETGALPPLEDAAKFALKPVVDANDAYAMALGKYAKRQAESSFHKMAQAEFGIPMKAFATGKQADKLGRDIGLESVSNKFFAGGQSYFPPEIARNLQRHAAIMADPRKMNEFASLTAKVTNMWKTGMTTVNPGHHVRNMVGDIWNGFLDGVSDPRVYGKSLDVLTSWRKNPNRPIMRIGKKTLNAGEIMDLWRRSGGKATFYSEELANTNVWSIEKLRQWSEKREDFGRLAHFIDALKKEAAPGKITEATRIKDATIRKVGAKDTLEDAAQRASARVRKFHFDYGDLTPTERSIRKFVPFYTWQRKNIPLQIETLMMNPGKILAAKKGMNALQSLMGTLGIEEPTIDGIPTTPQWLREMSGVRLAGEGVGRNGIYWDPGILPSVTPFQMLEGGGPSVTAQLLSQLNPALTGSIQYATGKKLFSGTPTRGGALEQVSGQVLPPSITAALKAAGITVPGVGVGGPGTENVPLDIAKLLGAGLHQVGEPQMESERIRQDIRATQILRKKKKKEKEERERKEGKGK